MLQTTTCGCHVHLKKVTDSVPLNTNKIKLKKTDQKRVKYITIYSALPLWATNRHILWFEKCGE